MCTIHTHLHTQSCPHYTYNPYYMKYQYLRFCFWNIQLVYKSLQSILTNSNTHSISTRNNSSFHQPLSHMTIYQKGPFYMGTKIYNSLPPKIKICLIILRKLNHLWEGFFTNIHFIHWMNISNCTAVDDIF
jgi:hypothetical protein